MADDHYTTGELGRRLTEIQQRLDAYVGRLEYDAELRGMGRQLGDLERALAEERRDREQELRDMRQQLKDQAQAASEARLSWRSVLWTGLLPALMVVAGIIVQIMLARSGGHR